MAIEAAVHGQGSRLVVRVERYEFPDETTGSDANWVVGEVDLTGSGGAFRARVRVTLRTDELQPSATRSDVSTRSSAARPHSSTWRIRWR